MLIVSAAGEERMLSMLNVALGQAARMCHLLSQARNPIELCRAAAGVPAERGVGHPAHSAAAARPADGRRLCGRGGPLRRAVRGAALHHGHAGQLAAGADTLNLKL